MKKDESHLSDRELIMAMDGELRARDLHRVDAHIQACWVCRSRKIELESVIAEFVRTRREDIRLPSAEGPRAMLKARIHAAQAENENGRSWWSQRHLAKNALIAALACVSLTVLLVTQMPIGERHPSVVLAAPNPALTPGAAILEPPAEVCQQSNQGNREVDPALRRRVFAEYGIGSASAKAYEVDYLITPALGGADDIRNLWPHSYRNTEWNAKVKDALEDKLRDLVCQGQLDLATAQREIATNWIEAYKKYFHTEHPLREQE